MDLSFEQFASQFKELGQWDTMIDVLLVTFIIYIALRLIQGTRAIPVLRGFLILAALLFAVISATSLELPALSWLIERTLPALFLAIPVIFQPELRRALERLGATGRIWRLFQRNKSDPVIETVVQSAMRLSQRRHGALIVFEQETKIQEYVDTGVLLDAQPSVELFLTLFNKNTELHDGAVIIREGKVAAAACVMPLSSGNLSDRQLGLRHRAALGISEVSDAVSLVVSEETGQFAITHNGRILRRQPAERLMEILTTFIQKQPMTRQLR